MHENNIVKCKTIVNKCDGRDLATVSVVCIQLISFKEKSFNTDAGGCLTHNDFPLRATRNRM